MLTWWGIVLHMLVRERMDWRRRAVESGTVWGSRLAWVDPNKAHGFLALHSFCPFLLYFLAPQLYQSCYLLLFYTPLTCLFFTWFHLVSHHLTGKGSGPCEDSDSFGGIPQKTFHFARVQDSSNVLYRSSVQVKAHL